jgi:hypothetical protein
VADTIRTLKKVKLKQYEPTEPMTINEKDELVPKVLTKFEEMKLSQALRDYSTLKNNMSRALSKRFDIWKNCRFYNSLHIYPQLVSSPQLVVMLLPVRVV